MYTVPSERPNLDEYFMTIAIAVRRRANCLGNRVGAVIVTDGHIVSTGYNGTPTGMTNCSDGGCPRCAEPERYPSGTGYDLCICVHAEQNALLAAARFGIAVEGSTVYTTMRPCFGCTKEMLQAGVHSVYYMHDWVHPDAEKRVVYEALQARLPKGIHHLAIQDPDGQWAVTRWRTPQTAEETGHSRP